MNSWILRAMSRLAGLFGQKQAESEFDAEMQAHLQLLTEHFLQQGMNHENAAAAARRQFGNTTLLRQRQRESRTFLSFSTVFQDVQYGLRILRKSPGFTAIAVASLALAIGANTTIFSLAKSLLYDRLHVPHPEQLRLLRWIGNGHNVVHSMWGDFDPAPGGGMLGSCFSYPVFEQLRLHNHALQDLAAYNEDSMNLTVRGNAQRANVDMVSTNFFNVLEVRAQLGRSLQPSDDQPGTASPVAMISDALWEREFGRSSSALGQTISVNHAPFTIVGVAPRGFTGAKNVQTAPEVFVPITMQPVIDPKGDTGGFIHDPNMWWVVLVGRVKPGVTDAQAQAEMNVAMAAAIRGTMTVQAGDTIPLLRLDDGSRGNGFIAREFGKPMYVLLALTGFVLLLACANIANLLLARSAQRQRELSVRIALGAGRGRVLRQLLTESLLLAGMGGAGGVLLGYAGRNVIPRLMANAWDRDQMNVPMDWGVFAFAAAVTLVTGVVFGLAPAWLAARSEVGSSLKQSAQTATRRRKGFGGKAIVGFQIALSTLLVVGAGLFLRTLMALNSIDVGFRTDHLVLFEVDPPAKRYAQGKDVRLHQRLEQEFADLPGVEAVAPAQSPYLAGTMNNADFLTEGEVDQGDHGGAEDVNVVGNSFFTTMGIPIVNGRSFASQDTASSLKVAIINQALAKKRFPNMNPVGKRLQTDGNANAWVQIVGVCADTRYATLRDPSPPQFFMPYVQQANVGGLTYAIRTQLPIAALLPALRRVVQGADRDLPIIDVRTQQEQIDATMQMERLFAALTAGFGVLALALACVGIYGIMAYSVADRRNEIGIRLAMGARPGQVRRMILQESTWLAVTGIGVGVGAALLLTRLVKSMLWAIQPYDPPTMAAGILLLLAVALAATLIPARRAAGVQPMEALRHE
jgi:predicted permease